MAMLLQGSGEAKHRICKSITEMLEFIRHEIQQKRYRHAYNESLLYYEKAHASLHNAQIFMLAYLAYKAVCKKLKLELCSHNASVEELHKLSIVLFASLQEIVYEEVAENDPVFFNRLSVTKNTIDLKRLFQGAAGLPGEVFARRPGGGCMAKGQAYKELNRFVRELLKMTVLTLYSSTAKSAKGANISHLFVTAQAIFSQVAEHNFPDEMMEYEILKLQYVEMHEQTGQSLSVKYRFPIHFIHRVYCIGSRKFFHKTGHFVRQLKKYVFLGFKHWEMQPSDIFVLCHELINLINYLISLHKPESFQTLKQGYSFRKGSCAKPAGKLCEEGQNEQLTKYLKSLVHFSDCLEKMLTRLARLYDSKQELEHVVRTYLKEVHDRHVKNDERDEFIDEIVQIEQDSKKRRWEEAEDKEGWSERKRGMSTGLIYGKSDGQKKDQEEQQENEQRVTLEKGIRDGAHLFIRRNIAKVASKEVLNEKQKWERQNKIQIAQSALRNSKKYSEMPLLVQQSSDSEGEAKHVFEQGESSMKNKVHYEAYKCYWQNRNTINQNSKQVPERDVFADLPQPAPILDYKNNRFWIESLQMKRKMSVDIEDIIQKRSNHPNIRRSSTVVLESDDFLRERNINQGLEKQKKTQKEEKARKPKLKLKEPSQEEEIDPRVIRELMLEKLMQPGQDQKQSSSSLRTLYDHLRRDVAKYQFNQAHDQESSHMATIRESDAEREQSILV